MTSPRSPRPGLRRTTLSAWAAVALLAVVPAVLGSCGPGDRHGLPEAGAEILWDEYGVPHIFAASNEALFRAFGRAQARSHGRRLLHLLGSARGRAAEYFGEDALSSDRWVRTMGVPGRAEAWLAEQEPRMRRYLEAFTEGINGYADDHPGTLGEEARRVLPVRPTDVLALAQRDIHFTFVTNAGVVRRLERRWEPDTTAARSGGGRPGSDGRVRLASRPRLDVRPRGGSNAWAVGPSRSASGNALLLANPHLPWGGLFTWYEAQLVSPDVDAYGATLLGFPVLGIAFNDRLGWTHTVNTIDAADLYELELADGGYRFDGEVRAFQTRVDTLLVRGEDGEMREEPLPVRHSVHGPVLVEKGGHAVALRVAGLDGSGIFRQYWDMMRAGDLEDFEAALRRLQIPMFTVMYADRDGHVLHLFGGRTPDRPRGEWDWDGVVPGDTSATLWTGTHGYDDLPRVLDPESGWLQNANDPPWTTTFPPALDPDDFPPYMAPRGMALRPQRSAGMLAEDTSVTFEELVRHKHSTRMLLADRILDDLLPAARERGDGRARKAADVLEAWDRSADASSRGAVLFHAWAATLDDRSEGSIFARPWSPDEPRSTPDGLSDPDAAVEALSVAAATVEERWGRRDAPWGETRRGRRDSLDLPGNGASGWYGVFRVVGFARTEGARRRADFGDSFVAAVEFGDTVRARALLGYGNASRDGSPHRTDQLRHMHEQELRPVWRSHRAVEEHTEERTAVPGG